MLCSVHQPQYLPWLGYYQTNHAPHCCLSMMDVYQKIGTGFLIHTL